MSKRQNNATVNATVDAPVNAPVATPIAEAVAVTIATTVDPLCAMVCGSDEAMLAAYPEAYRNAIAQVGSVSDTNPRKRPAPTGKCGVVWLLYDVYVAAHGAEPTGKYIENWHIATGLTVSNGAIELSQVRKHYGKSGRIASANVNALAMAYAAKQAQA